VQYGKANEGRGRHEGNIARWAKRKTKEYRRQVLRSKLRQNRRYRHRNLRSAKGALKMHRS
jgi:hypothetical protein